MRTPPTFPEASLIKVNDVNIEVFEAGRENAGRPIVLCHGWPELAYTWRHQIPALVEAGYHVIAPNQRGYGNSSRPEDVSAYGITNLTADLVGLLDHYGYEDATFVGHDWGAMVVWGLALLHSTRVNKIINLSLPYQDRGDVPWIEALEAFFGSDYYFVHFNRQPGVADAVFDANARQFLNNLYRKNVPPAPPEPGMALIQLAQASAAPGEPIMSDEDLAVFTEAFQASGFTGGINWYRNLDSNWHTLGRVDPVIHQPTLMIYGTQDTIPPSPTLTQSVPRADVVELECGHWIPEELPEETNAVMLNWLHRHEGL